MIALLLSLFLHVYVWLMAVLLQSALKNGWLPPWLQKAVQPVSALLVPSSSTNTVVRPQESWDEIPLQFVEVDPSQVSEEAPDNSPFFSTANTRAANPNPPKVDTGKPRIDGWREDSIKTFDTPRPAEKPVPVPPKVTEVAKEESTEKKAQEPKPKVEPVEAQPAQPGETLIAKANPKATPTPPPTTPQPPQQAQEAQDAQPATPRKQFKKRLSEVIPTKGALVGERMKQEGGVTRPSIESSLDVKSSPLGDYHYRMVLLVQQQWYRLLEERLFARERLGKVVIKFDLHSDGTITGLETKNSDVGEVLSFLCELSVMQPAPFGRWPPDVRRLVGGDVIPVTFTFNYY